MDNITFSRTDHTVTGLNRPPGPFEYSLTLPFPITVTKSIAGVNGEKQKIDENGQLLYKGDLTVDDNGLETYNEVTTARIATAWEEVSQDYNLVNEDGSTTPITNKAKVAIAWDDLQPVMVPNIIYSAVSFAEQPSLFTFDELNAAKCASLEKSYKGKLLLYYDEDFSLENFAVDLAEHAANMGDGVIALHPRGKCRTVKLPLGESVDKVQLYLEAQDGITVEVGAAVGNLTAVVDGAAQLPSAADAVYIRFTNTTDSYKEVYAFGILA
ncbi:hypothetical protein M2444_002319 [Paenibacillus sp. PastF-3]|uniref:hypothetical protein n=1 Tax=Paenibacillus sp. PastF-3 TaxID=2940626 RepID=UPI0024766233|nr:hypothetical protein [Paenibacillus sp. PastF-3]MDH6370539.1 hypothetical protein [Paenibacillus sp. PastF-3]